MQQSPLEILHIGTFKQNEMIYVSKKKIFFVVQMKMFTKSILNIEQKN
jgi:hypothetical protein